MSHCSQVGAGSFGAVWKAQCRGRDVAVKQLGNAESGLGGAGAGFGSMGLASLFFGWCEKVSARFEPSDISKYNISE